MIWSPKRGCRSPDEIRIRIQFLDSVILELSCSLSLTVSWDLDADTGEGMGQMLVGAETSHDKGTDALKLESMTMNPTKLTKVKTEKDKD